MKEIWQRIDRWLQVHAPEVLSSLNSGATDEMLTATEAALGVAFPDDLKASYRVHDGQSDDGAWLLNGWQLLSLEDLSWNWNVWKELLDGGDFDKSRGDPEGPIVGDWWSVGWIPLTYDGSGNHQCLDLSPAPGGRVGQIIQMWHDDPQRTVVANSFREWLGQFADDLEHDEYVWSSEYGSVVRKDEL